MVYTCGNMNSQIERLRYLINARKTTFMGVGPMSKDCVDTLIDLANDFELPIALIPSRRQVECEALGGGYVENWSTEVFAEYVQRQDTGSHVILSRDHCGPWQIPPKYGDTNIPTLAQEMASVKLSLQADITAGFQIIHIDPSLGLKFGLSKCDVHEIVYELVGFCESVKTAEILYEIGTEEQEYASRDLRDADEELRIILDGLDSHNLPRPIFFVQQTGTKVQELRNVGNYDNHLDSKRLLPASVHVPMVLKMCELQGIWLKEHNADYISDEAIRWHRRHGIHAANVAPEFGVKETQTLLAIAKELHADNLISEFHTKVLAGGKWEKWMLPNSQATDFERVQIAGHYHFSDGWASEWRKELFAMAQTKGIDGHVRVVDALRTSLMRYLLPFGYK